MIYLGMSGWEGMWKNRHQLMSRFAGQMPVLYVEPWYGLRKLRRTPVSASGIWREFRQPASRTVAPGLHIFRSPAYLPVSHSRFLRDVTLRRWFGAVRRAACDIGIVNPILWLSRPEMWRAVGNMGEILSIYHLVDEYAGYTAITDEKKTRLAQREERILDSTDLTIAVSPQLIESKKTVNRDVVLVENAVDFERFCDARKNRQLPDDLKFIQHPRLGYCGLIGRRLNLGLLLDLARSHPEWSLVLVGKVDDRNCERDIAALNKLPNVHFLGEKPAEMVADYITGFDVGLLPYQIDLETTNISPLKMYEYLAAGIPVVSTAIPAATRKQNFVAIAKDVADFDRECRIVVDTSDATAIEARLLEASQNTWDHRIIELSTIIRHRLASQSIES